MDLEKFRKTKFQKRTRDIDVPRLQEFLFSDGEAPLWKIQSLSTEELSIVRDAASKNAMVGQMVLALMGGNQKEKISAMLDSMGMTDDQPENVARDIEAVLYGSVELEPNDPQHRDVVIKLAESFPIEFQQIAGGVWDLTGEGSEVVGKPQDSTKPTKSNSL